MDRFAIVLAGMMVGIIIIFIDPSNSYCSLIGGVILGVSLHALYNLFTK